MKILLRSLDTGAYVASSAWTLNRSAATVFDSGLDAYDHSIAHRLRRMEIVISFPDATRDYNVAIRERATSRRL